MYACPSCGHKIALSTVVCPSCGGNIEEEKKRARRNAITIEDLIKFLEFCGFFTVLRFLGLKVLEESIRDFRIKTKEERDEKIREAGGLGRVWLNIVLSFVALGFIGWLLKRLGL